jgi:hypothetical protein
MPGRNLAAPRKESGNLLSSEFLVGNGGEV